MDKRVETFAQVDFSGIHAPSIAIYKHPKGYPNDYIARLYNGKIPTDTVMISQSLEEIMTDIEENTDMIFFERSGEDDPCVMGAWL
jgi:hypothetical protein